MTREPRATTQPDQGWTSSAAHRILRGAHGDARTEEGTGIAHSSEGTAGPAADPDPPARPADHGVSGSAERGPKAGFKEVVRPHLPALYALAGRLTDADQAEELVQDCLVKAYRSFDQLRDPDAVGGWLRTILMNVVRDAARAQAREPDEVPVEEIDTAYSLFRKIADEDPLPYSDSVHLDFLSCFTVPDVWAVLDRLPAHYRTPLVLVHMYGVPTKEVATALALPKGTLLSQLHRGRKLFERELWEYAEENDLLREREGAMP